MVLPCSYRSPSTYPGPRRPTRRRADASALERADGARDRDRGLGLEEEVVDEHVLVGPVLGLEVGQGLGVGEGDESVDDGPVGLAQDVAVAVAVGERGDEAGVRVSLCHE